MTFKTILMGAAALGAVAVPSAASAVTLYTDRAAFEAASGDLNTENFNGLPTSSTDTSLTFGDVTFNCDGAEFCPGFFGTRTFISGSQSVFFATPSTATFTFAYPIEFFGVDIFGVGTAIPADFSVSIDGTSYLLKSQFSGAGTDSFFFGISGSSFSSLTFSGTAFGDGVDFDNLAFGAVAPVPEPATWAMFLLGFGAVGYSMRRRKGTTAQVSFA